MLGLHLRKQAACCVPAGKALTHTLALFPCLCRGAGDREYQAIDLLRSLGELAPLCAPDVICRFKIGAAQQLACFFVERHGCSRYTLWQRRMVYRAFNGAFLVTLGRDITPASS